jgi:hypothetical protein
MLAIYKKELKSYFTSMIGYVFIALFLAVMGIYFTVYNLAYAYSNFEYVLQSLSFLFVIIVPVLTMRIIAEETKQKTDQLLYTSPITIEQIVIGKYLAVITLFFIAMAVTLFYPLILTQFGTVNLAVTYAGIFGFVLLGAAYLAVGLFISALTESQVISAVVCFIVTLITYLMSGLVNMLPKDHTSSFIMLTALLILICIITYLIMHNATVSICLALIGETVLAGIYVIKPTWYDGIISKLLGCLAVTNRFDNFTLGILDLTSIFYYLSIIILFIFLTIQSIKKRRWS